MTLGDRDLVWWGVSVGPTNYPITRLPNYKISVLPLFETDQVPDHRRIDPKKARLKVAARAGSVSVALTIRNAEWEYGTRRLVHLAQEVFMVFLHDGPYSDYRVAQLGLDPESVWA